jgi:hypothetical protein
MTGIALALTLLISAEPAASDDNTAKARAAFQWAQKLYKEARYASAIEKFEEAYRLKPHPSILFNIGRCYEQLGEIPRALRSYRDYLKAMPDAKDKEQVTSAILNLERRLKDEGVQQLIVYTDPSGAFVTIDDKAYGSSPAAVELRPGNHLVKITLDGYVTVTRNFVMSAEKSVELSFALKPEAKKDAVAEPTKKDEPEKKSDAPTKKDEPTKVSDTKPKTEAGTVTATTAPPQKKGRLFTFVAGGVAVAGLATGIILGAASAGAQADLKAGNGGLPRSGEENQKLADTANGTAIGANVSYGVAGAAAIAAVILFFVEGAGSNAPAQGAAGGASSSQ